MADEQQGIIDAILVGGRWHARICLGARHGYMIGDTGFRTWTEAVEAGKAVMEVKLFVPHKDSEPQPLQLPLTLGEASESLWHPDIEKAAKGE